MSSATRVISSRDTCVGWDVFGEENPGDMGVGLSPVKTRNVAGLAWRVSVRRSSVFPVCASTTVRNISWRDWLSKISFQESLSDFAFIGSQVRLA